MKYITIQSDIDISKPFIEGFVNVGNNMESIADKLELQISGYLTPYSLNCTLVGETSCFKNFSMNVRRKLENVTTNVLPMISPYSNIIELHADVATDVSKAKVKIDRKGFLKKMINNLSGLKECKKTDTHVLYSNGLDLGRKISSTHLESLGKLDWLKFNGKHLKIRSLFIPESESEILDWLNSIEALIKRFR